MSSREVALQQIVFDFLPFFLPSALHDSDSTHPALIRCTMVFPDQSYDVISIRRLTFWLRYYVLCKIKDRSYRAFLCLEKQKKSCSLHNWSNDRSAAKKVKPVIIAIINECPPIRMKKDIESIKDDCRVWAEKQNYEPSSNIFSESGDGATSSYIEIIKIG